MSVIAVKNLTKCFGSVRAVDDLSFEVEPGTVVGFLGPNGAGKTTTLRMLFGLISPSSGTATINGQPYRELAQRSRIVGAALEASSAHPGRTARNHLRVRATSEGVVLSRVDEVLALVELTDYADRRVAGFSLGMRQRLGLAAALLGDPELLILDEPANGLDPEGVRWLRELLRGFARDGRTVLVSSHVLGEVAQTVSDVVIIDQGHLVTQSPLRELLESAPQIVLVRSSQASVLRDALKRQGLASRPIDAGRFEVANVTAEFVANIAAGSGIPLFECVAQPPDLEEIFLRLIGDDQVKAMVN